MQKLRSFLGKARDKAKGAITAATTPAAAHAPPSRRRLGKLKWAALCDRVFYTAFPSASDEQASAKFLNSKYAGRFLVFNLSVRRKLPNGASEEAVHASLFQDAVVSFSFPNHSSPLLLLVELAASLHRWLAADEGNIVVVHSLSAGRALMAVAAYLVYAGRADSSLSVLHELASRHSLPECVPSQRRHAQLVTDLLTLREVPNRQPLVLHLLVVPRLHVGAAANSTKARNAQAKAQTAGDASPSQAQAQAQPEGGPTAGAEEGKEEDEDAPEVLVPHIQVLRGSTLLYSTTWEAGEETGIVHSQSEEQTAVKLGYPVMGDVVLKCYQAKTPHARGRRKQIFRYHFNTGTHAAGLTRITAAQLDSGDFALPSDFFVDLVFKPCETYSEETEALAKHGKAEFDQIEALIAGAPALTRPAEDAFVPPMSFFATSSDASRRDSDMDLPARHDPNSFVIDDSDDDDLTDGSLLAFNGHAGGAAHGAGGGTSSNTMNTPGAPLELDDSDSISSDPDLVVALENPEFQSPQSKKKTERREQHKQKEQEQEQQEEGKEQGESAADAPTSNNNNNKDEEKEEVAASVPAPLAPTTASNHASNKPDEEDDLDAFLSERLG